MQMYITKDDGCLTDWHMVHLGKFAIANFGTVFTEVLCVKFVEGVLMRMLEYRVMNKSPS